MRSCFLFVLLFSLALLFSFPCFAVEKAERISDREIIESLAELKAGQKAMEQRFDQRFIDMDKRLDSMDKRLDSMDKRLDMLQAIMLGGFGVLATGMMSLVGFVLWDRRSALVPAVRKTNELEEELAAEKRRRRELEDREQSLLKALKDFGSHEPRLLEALKSAHLL